MAEWRNRIVGHGEEAPDQLLAHPLNFRRHPKHQQAALEGALGEIGWIDEVIVNTTTGYVIDGHARVERAIAKGEPTVPVKYVELSEEEERAALASFDALGALAFTDHEVLAELRDATAVNDDALAALIAGRHISSPAGEWSEDDYRLDGEQKQPEPPAEFPSYDDDIETQYRCPACQYEWSGKPK